MAGRVVGGARIVGWSLGLLFAAPAVGQEALDLDIEDCQVELPGGEILDYELGVLYVPENREDEDSRIIGLGFARFPAEDPDPAVPPIFWLPGGPGSSMVDRLREGDLRQRARAAEDFARFRSIADLVLVDQRGFSRQGEGEVLTASWRGPPRPADRASSIDDQVAELRAFARAAVEQAEAAGVDLSGYTVKECAHDVDDLCAMLGYDELTLMGTSFGSQWSFAVMRLHPDIVARALLSGVEPLDHAYDMPSGVFSALLRMWSSLEDDPAFAPYLPEGGMAEAARVVIERLEREPLVLTATSAAGETEVLGTMGPLDFPWRDPASILELYHGHTRRFAAQAAGGRGGDRRSQPLIGPLIDSSLGVSPERRRQLWNDPATRYIGRSNFAGYLGSAELWPSPDVGDDFRRAQLCEIPVLMAQGDWDTSTPIENTYEIAPYFPNGRVIVAERGGHGVLPPIERELPEVWAQIEEFLRTGDLEDVPARVRLAPSRRFAPPNFPRPERDGAPQR